MMQSGPARVVGLAGALAVALAPVAAEAALPCPDPSTVQAARLVEFQTMMMDVSVRCNHVGVTIGSHLNTMNEARRTMFGEAHDRVAGYLRGTSAPPPSLPPALAAPPAKAGPAKPAPGTKPAAAKSAPAKAAPGKPAPAVTAKAKAGTAKSARARTALASKAAVTKQPVPTPAPTKSPAAGAKSATAKAPVAKAPAAKPPAKFSRRTDPYDRYLTMIGNQYGGGITTLQRCKAFDAIVLSLADKTNTDRLLTMVSSSLVQATLLEAIVNCPAGK